MCQGASGVWFEGLLAYSSRGLWYGLRGVWCMVQGAYGIWLGSENVDLDIGGTCCAALPTLPKELMLSGLGGLWCSGVGQCRLRHRGHLVRRGPDPNPRKRWEP